MLHDTFFHFDKTSDKSHHLWWGEGGQNRVKTVLIDPWITNPLSKAKVEDLYTDLKVNKL
ncbi:MAG: hypothetical protein ACP5ML_02610 [Fervidicoccus sp.]